MRKQVLSFFVAWFAMFPLIAFAQLKQVSGGGGGISQSVGDARYVNVSGDTMTGPLLLPDGSNAAPSIAFADETNTGVYQDAVQGLAFTINGTRVGRFDADEFNLFTNSVGQIKISNGSAINFAADGTTFDVGVDYSAAGVLKVTNGSTGSGSLVTGAGGGTETLTVGGVIESNTTQAGTPASLAETDLWSYTLPANTLNANNQAVRVKISGAYAANANTKTTRVYFGGNVLVTRATAFNDTKFSYTVTVYRTGASAEYYLAEFQDAVGAAPFTGTIAVNTAANIIIKLTGENGTASANDIRFEAAIVEYLP